MLAGRREDDISYRGDAKLGIEGIVAAKGVNTFAMSDGSEGENAVMDLARGLEMLIDQGNSGERALVLSTDLYAKLHRIQPGTGIMEVDRVRSLVGKMFHTSRLEKNTACLVYNEPQNMDLVIGQDMITAYMGNENPDDLFRVLETAMPLINPGADIAVIC